MTSTAADNARLTGNEFRKVELQSTQDLAYLIALTQRAARQKIDVAFPPSAAPTNGEDDGMRRRVEELVSQFVDKTWDGVRANVSCNGVDMVNGGEKGSDGAEEFEPLDAKLAEKIRALEAEKEKLTLRVTGLRREAPAQAAANFQTRWAAEGQAFDAQMAEQKANAEAESMDLDLGEFKRWEDVQATYAKSTEGLVKLTGDLTETVAKLERAKSVATHVYKQ